jgi:hypothetical protein
VVKLRLLVVLVAVLLITAGTVSAEEVKWITKDELRAQLKSPDITVIDVRKDKDWNASDVMIEGAVREDAKYVSRWSKKYSKDSQLVFY